MGEIKKPDSIPQWMWNEVCEYDLPLAQPPATVLDIGANIGAFTLLAAQRWPQAIIRAYEPADENRDGLFRNTDRVNVIIDTRAVRSFSGPANIFIGDRGVTCSFHQLGRQTQDVERCQCVDAATLASAEFVKIDTEGCEVEILERLDLSQTKVLCVEYHRAADKDRLADLARAAGLQLHKFSPKGETWGLLVFARPGAIATKVADKRKLFLALPVYGGLEVFFTQSLIKLLNDPPCELMVRMNPGDSLVARARNTLTADFLESDATHLLFIDSDLIFSGEQVLRILNHPEDVVGGFYPKKQEGPLQWVCNATTEPNAPRADGLQEVRYMGTGFLRIHRRVFERMIEVFGTQIQYRADHTGRIEHDFWSVGTYEYPDGSRRYLSEDWFFCQRALDFGFKVWGDTRIVLKHVGQAIYPLQTQQAEILSSPTAGNGTPGADAIRPSSAPALSSNCVLAGPI